MPEAKPHSVHPDGLLRFPTYVLGQLHKGFHTEIDESLREHWVLVCLDESKNLSQQDLSDSLGIDRSDVVRLIDGLEGDGFVLRTRDSTDRRKYQLSITAAGRSERRRVDSLIRESTDHALAALDPDERYTLHRLALKALGRSEDLAPPPE
ncbi:MarR family winged helix-turn-helix transcriptional regulator [Antrihabitans cavernicola]|uniref:MarR family transcriptional regulator n=1 Tax=Antrihabitans cavernicola TaxID=2495913 RepID=A0A5A7SIJ8_9NOCA|nr:MarR family transcriptional regulator [Spelaeibacter cavernicola]KAA0024423.1 MarR family transcriptional regulator [Spelaeibacter cavernicola]